MLEQFKDHFVTTRHVAAHSAQNAQFRVDSDGTVRINKRRLVDDPDENAEANLSKTGCPVRCPHSPFPPQQRLLFENLPIQIAQCLSNSRIIS